MSNGRPLVTVVTTTYHWPAVLRIAIQSVLAQSYGDFEYLIIGDACTDETESVVASFHDPRIRWLNLAQNSGNQSTPNRVAVEQARGKYVAYLNHDDIWLPHHLSALVLAMEASQFDLLWSLCLEIAPPGSAYRNVLGLPDPDPQHGKAMRVMTSAIIHPAEAARAVGNWRDWRSLHTLPTIDFMERLRQRRKHFGMLKTVSVLKFNSADRPGSYSRKSGEEQAHYWQLICNDADFLHRELLAVIESGRKGLSPPKLEQAPMPADPPPGWQIEQWRRMRGLDPMLTTPPADSK